MPLWGQEFLNQAELPIDICEVAQSAVPPGLADTPVMIQIWSDHFVAGHAAQRLFHVETLGMCTGRYTKRNKLNIAAIDAMIERCPPRTVWWRKISGRNMESGTEPLPQKKRYTLKRLLWRQQVTLENPKRDDIVILGSAGMRIVTAGDIVCFAGMVAGLNASMKNDYNITVLRGQSVSELILSPDTIGYAGLETPSIVLALSDEGVQAP